MPELRGSALGSHGGWIRGVVGVVLLTACVDARLATAAPKPTDYCWLPLAIADRWNDTASFPGYLGGDRKTPDWRNNGRLDHEAFTDLNQNGVYDPGEPFVDGNGNGVFDSEAYGPLTTGYVLAPTPDNTISPAGDVNLELTLEPAGSVGDESPGHYVAIQQNCLNVAAFDRATGADVQSIDRLLRSIIGGDPAASWDPVTQTVIGSTTPCRTPRVVQLPLYDPRSALTSSHDTLVPTKLVTAFLESMVGKGVVRVVLVPPTAGSPCNGGDTDAASTSSITTPPPATWGRLKASYR